MPDPLSRRHLWVAGLGAATLGLLGPATRSNAQTARLRGAADGDFTDALSTALRQASRSGQTLTLPRGRFRVDRIVLPPGAILVGSGRETVLEQGGTGPILVGEGPGPLSVSNLSLEGRGAADPSQPLFLASGIGQLRLADMWLRNARGTAVHAERCGGAFSNLQVTSADTAIHALDAAGLVITGCQIAECDNNGIQVWRSFKGYDGTQVLGNRVSSIGAKAGGSGQNGNGINVYRAGNVIVAQNVVRDCAFSAIRANAAGDVQISSNQCTNLGEVAIFVEFGYEGASVSNNVVNGASAGISVTNFDHGGRLASVTGNLIRKVVRRPEPITGRINQGYGIAAEADAVLTGNVVESAEYAAYVIGYGPYLRDVICANNLARASGIGVAVSVAPGAGAAQISGNIIAGCRTGIAGLAWDEIVETDLNLRAARFPQLSVSANLVRPGPDLRPSAR